MTILDLHIDNVPGFYTLETHIISSYLMLFSMDQLAKFGFPSASVPSSIRGMSPDAMTH